MTIKEPSLIRKREWYKRWIEMIELIDGGDATTEKIVRHVFGVIDECKGFGSRTKANFAKESLDQALKDRKLIKETISR